MHRFYQSFILAISFISCFMPFTKNDLHSSTYLETTSSNENEFWLIRPLEPKGHGFFSICDLVLGYLSLYEKSLLCDLKGFKVDLGEEGHYYDPSYGANWWEYYFEPVCIGDCENVSIKSSCIYTNEEAWRERYMLSRTEANRLINKYIKIKPEILNKVTRFIRNKFKGYHVIGVHYRGTDKAIEAPRISYETVIETINDYVHSHQISEYKIFVATDEQLFLEFIQQAFPEKVIATSAVRSSNHLSVHGNQDHPYKIGKEALIDAILLSKCHILIRTSSNLSLWSTFLNPDIEEILLNQKYSWISPE